MKDVLGNVLRRPGRPFDGWAVAVGPEGDQTILSGTLSSTWKEANELRVDTRRGYLRCGVDRAIADSATVVPVKVRLELYQQPKRKG